MNRLVICVCVFLASTAGVPTATAEQPGKLKELREKRIAVLEEVHDITEKAFKSGQLSFDQVAKARLDLLQAQLDASETKDDRIRLLGEMVEHAETLEKAVNKQFDAKGVGRVDALKARAFVLETKIALEQARATKPLERGERPGTMTGGRGWMERAAATYSSKVGRVCRTRPGRR